MRSGRISGISEDDFVDYYGGARAASTMKVYNSAYKLVADQADKLGKSVFRWGEGEVAGMFVRLNKEGKGEEMMKKVSAVVNMLFEAAGLVSPTKGDVLKVIKKTAVKNIIKEKEVKRRGLTLEDMEVFIKRIFTGERKDDSLSKKRMLALLCLLFFGVRRFDDVQRIKVKDVMVVGEDKVEIKLGRTKTDQAAKGSTVKISGSTPGGISVGKILKWFITRAGLKSEDFLFCKTSKDGQVVKGKYVTYDEARKSLLEEQAMLGISGLTLHSGRIGGATVAVELGATREDVKKAGGWKSDAVDVYIRDREDVVSFILMDKMRC